MRNRIVFVGLVLLALAACGDDNNNQSCEERGNCATGACDPNPCANGGSCSEAGSSFSCSCLPGYGGATCADNIDECAGAPCLNGGTCVDGINGYTCSCTTGWTGTLCADDVNECAAATSPCSPNAICTNNPGSYVCQCTGDYVGNGVTCTSTLIGDWHLDGNGNDATGAHNGTVESASETTGYLDDAYNFTSAASSVVRIPYIDLRATSFTVQAWVRLATGTNSPVFTQCETATDGHCLRLGVGSNRAHMSFGGGLTVSNRLMAYGEWYHLAWVYDADTETLRIYVNGILDTENTDQATYLGASGETAIGRHLVNAVSADATIDEVKLFDRARSGALIAADAQDVIRYDFADGTATDRGRYGRTGTVSAGATAVGGDSGTALSLDPTANGGDGAYVRTPGIAVLGDGGPFTIEIRALATAATGATLVHLSASPDATSWCMPMLGLTSSGLPAAQLYSESAVGSVVGTDAIVPGSWTRLTQSFDPFHGVRLFVDGELVAVDADLSDSQPSVSALAYAFAGAGPGTCENDVITQGPFDGAIDDLRIDRGERSADDIAAGEGFDHACSYILAEHPAFTTTARDLALCGNNYLSETIHDACNTGWHVCSVSEWRARVLPPDFEPGVDPAPPINGPLTSWGAPQSRRCAANFWEANRPLDAEVWDGDVCGDAYNPWNNGKYLLDDDGTTILEGNGECCNWDSDFAPFVPHPVYEDALAVYCCKT